MNNKLFFVNKGLLPLEAITTFGISAKDNDQAIGYFGTGLKYAIAILVRNGIEVKITSEGKEFNFSTKEESFRNNTFKFIYMNEVKLPFTTELGKNWELWQAYRELYCNCLDEKGYVTEVEPVDYNNSVVIEVVGDSFKSIHDDNSSIILNKITKKLLYKDKDIEIYFGNSDYVFYKNIRVYEPFKPTYFTYNILSDVKLTEDRTILYSFDIFHKIRTALGNCTDKKVILDLLTIPSKECYESHNLDFDSSSFNPNPTFIDCVKELVSSKNVFLNRTARAKIISICGIDLEVYDKLELNSIQQRVLTKSISFCKELNYPVDTYEIVCVKDLGYNILGLAKSNKIFLAERLFELGSKQVTACLLEEYLHLRYHLVDETRAMQNHLFDIIVSLGELVLNKDL